MNADTVSFLKKIIAATFLILISASVLFGVCIEKMDRGTFDFGHARPYVGTLIAGAIPLLRTPTRSYLLVGDGKFGANEWAERWSKAAAGKDVMFQGTLIEREPIAMIEIDRQAQPKILDSIADPKAAHPPEHLGPSQLQGELVDSKCYLGVMRPAVGKVHRGCAIRCLSGGVPPGILLRNAKIDTSVLVLLSGAGNKKMAFTPEWAGRTIRASGELEIRDGLPVLQVSRLILVND